MRQPAWLRAALLLTLLLAFALRLYRLDYQELRGDEVFGYFFSLRPLAEIVPATLELEEPHPVASYYIQHFWLTYLGDGAGQGEFALRFPVVCFGVVAVALLFVLGRLLLAPKSAYLAALLLATSPYAIWHSQDARMYSMSLALTLASTWLMVCWLQRRRRRFAVAYVVTTLLALHTHYFAVFMVLAQNLFLFIRVVHSGFRDKSAAKNPLPLSLSKGSLHSFILLISQAPRLRLTYINWLILQATVLFFYGPWLLQAQGILGNYGGNGDSPPLPTMLWRALSVFLVGESTPLGERLWWAWLAAFLLAMGAIVLWQQGESGRRTLLLVSCYLLIPLIATWWSAQSRPIFNERYLVAALPGFYLWLAALWPVAPTGNRLFRYAAVVLIGLCFVGTLPALQRHYTDPLYSKTRGWRELATTLTEWSNSLPLDEIRIAQNFPDPTLWYYYRGPVEHLVLPPQPHDLDGAQTAVADLYKEGVQQVLLPLQPALNWDENALAEAVLIRDYQPVLQQQVGVWPLRLYQRRFATVQSLTVPFQNGLQFNGFAHYPVTPTPGNVLVVASSWAGEIVTPTTALKVFVQLLNAQGELVAQHDEPFRFGAPSTQELAYHDILLPTTLPPGDYRLILGLYDGGAEGIPRVPTQGGADYIELTLLTVKREGR